MKFTEGQLTKATLLTSRTLRTAEEGATLLRLICKEHTIVAPTYVENDNGRYSIKFESVLVPSIVATWRGYFGWRRTKPSLLGAISHRGPRAPYHARISIWAQLKDDQIPPLVNFLNSCNQDMSSDFGLLHCAVENSLARAFASETVSYRGPGSKQYYISVSTHELRKYLPDLYWGTLLGPPYIELFGKDRLLSCPSYKVEEWNNAVWIQLSENPLDDPDLIEAACIKAKEHLGKDAFFDPDLPEDFPYRVPDFSYLTPPPDWK